MSGDYIKHLRRKRGTCKGTLTRLKTFLTTTTNLELKFLIKKQEQIEVLQEEFDTTQTELETQEVEVEDEVHSQEREEFENKYYECVEIINRSIKELTAAAQRPEPVERARGDIREHVSPLLQKIKVQKFNGQITDWCSFRDTFKSLVHENVSLPNVQKFHYLKDALEGDARDVIATLTVTRDNYMVAWNLLLQRYDRPRQIVQAHIKNFLDISEISRDTTTNLQSILERAQLSINSIKAQEIDVTNWDPFLVYVIATKLDRNTRRTWERSLENDEHPTFEQLIQFLKKQARGEDFETPKNHSNFSNIKKPNYNQPHKRGSQSFVVAQGPCPECKDSHYIQICPRFLAKTPQERYNAARQANLCLNCLRSNHATMDCRGRPCRVCNKKHNALLHFGPNPGQSNSSEPRTSTQEDVNTEPKLVHTVTSDTEVFLGTAVIKIMDKNNIEHMCRVLLDGGSQAHFMTTSMADKLQLKKERSDQHFAGLGQKSTSAQFQVSTVIKSRDDKFSSSLTFTTLPSITGFLPSRQVDKSILNIPKNIQLADPNFHQPQRVDALIGNTLFYNLLSVGQFKLSNNKIILQKTLLGWLVTGAIEMPDQRGTHVPHPSKSCHLVTSLDKQMERFWEIEHVPTKTHLSIEEQMFQKHFQETTTRTSDGRFQVRLPFKENISRLGESYNGALKRLQALERKFKSDPNLKTLYSQSIREHVTLNHITEITKNNVKDEGLYLPHHGVVKQASLTTKLRVVYDASAKTTSGISLNDNLLAGPTIQKSLFSIIINFRQYQYVFSTDIEKMYSQIQVDSRDSIFQKILWRFKEEDPVSVFMFTRVTFGLTSSPGQATACLSNLAQENILTYPSAANTILNRCYMDNILSGSNDIAETKRLANDLITILKQAGFELRQWASNTPELIEDIKESARAKNICLDANDDIKVLGIQWDPKSDDINYTVKPFDHQPRVTKRTILSQIAQLFDPLGLLGPVIVQAKLFMQQLWKINLDWDESVPQEVFIQWGQFKEQLMLLNHFNVPRKTIIANSVNVQLHGFADASNSAYGACIYLRSTDENNKHYVQLLCSKSRVAPLKTISIPRLELCAALLLVKLLETVKSSLEVKFDSIRLWSDSSIVLNWINSQPYTLKTFIANRIAEIQDFTHATSWFHISTMDNPADFISRGQFPREFMENEHWLRGPNWLIKNESEWTISEVDKGMIDKSEIRERTVLVSTRDQETILNRFSSVDRLVKFMAYATLWVTKHRTRKLRGQSLIPQERQEIQDNHRGILTVEDLQRARVKMTHLLQSLTFHKEINLLREGKPLPNGSQLLNLAPFLDTSQTIRVGGRLKNSNLTYPQKFPILLPKGHHVTKLIIQEAHEKTWHAGVQGTLSHVRQHYWPIDGKNLTRHVVRKCVRCFKFNPSQLKYQMGSLPEYRFDETRPFSNVGIDYCGPFLLKEKKFRNKNKIKAYVAVFVCFAIKAIHLELVTDLTTESCIAAIKRFSSRRGKPKNIFTDNGTNFVGAKNEFLKIQAFIMSDEYNLELNNYLKGQGIRWHFSPPRSPHFGGLWEAAVKSFKLHFYKCAGDALFTYEEFYTLTVEIEAVLNSRPLTPLSADPNDLTPLTPSHFLIGDVLLNPPEYCFQDLPVNKLSRWEHIQKIRQHFWSRWKKDYLHELQKRSKWHRNDDKVLDIGHLVLMNDDNAPSLKWKVGRVIEMNTGTDGITRVATVKTTDGVYTRGVKRLSPLPIEY